MDDSGRRADGGRPGRGDGRDGALRWMAITVLLAAAAAVLVTSAEAADAQAADARPAVTGSAADLRPCRFELPQSAGGWDGRPVRWHGPCPDGVAQGRGVLRAAAPAGAPRQPVLLYFGTMAQGRLALGAVDLPEGYVAGRFEGGRAVQDGDRNTLIAAFREASAAAQAAADGYRAAGNLGSARWYAAKAKELASQLD